MKRARPIATESWWLWVAAGVVMVAVGAVVATGRSRATHTGPGIAFLAAGVLVLAFGIALGAIRLRRKRKGPGGRPRAET